MTRKTEGLGPFLKALDARLAALDPEELRERLRAHARELPPAEREDFLSLLDPRPRRTERDEDLLADICSFVESVRAGDYFEYFGWDDEIHDERSFGDESWVWEMDDFFFRAGEAFLAGDMPLARDAHEKLLRAFDLEEEGNTFCGPRFPVDMVETDLHEAKARYFRALYESVPPEERAGRLCGEMLDLLWTGPSDAGFCAIRDAAEAPPGGFDAFLGESIEVLGVRIAAGEEETWSRTGAGARQFLREAVGLLRGTEGLADLARNVGATHPEAYFDWVEALAADGRVEEAIRAGEEGIGEIEEPGSRAALADRVAALSEEGEPSKTRDLRRASWRAEPTLRRLLALLGTAGKDGAARDALLEEEARAREEGDLELGRRMGARFDLLTGRYADAMARLEAASPIGWTFGDHPGWTVFPFLVLAGSGAESPPRNTVMAKVWKGVGGPSRMAASTDLDSDLPAGPDACAKLLEDALRRRPPSKADRKEALRVAKEVALARARAIVGGQKRMSYASAAQLAAAAAEALYLGGAPRAGDDLLEGLHAEFPRHIAFRRELRDAVTWSPILE